MDRQSKKKINQSQNEENASKQRNIIKLNLNNNYFQQEEKQYSQPA